MTREWALAIRIAAHGASSSRVDAFDGISQRDAEGFAAL